MTSMSSRINPSPSRPAPRAAVPHAGRGRRGSVLILVVALLVLLALVGTAYLTTTRVDRYAAVQYDSAVRIDLLVDGWKNTVVSAVIDDLFDSQGNFRPASLADDPRDPTSYENFDAPATKKYSVSIGTNAANDPFPVRHGDEWLSARAPWLENPYQVPDSATGANKVIWPYVGGPLLENRFSTPFVAVGGSLTTANLLRSDPVFSVRNNVIVTSVDLQQDSQGLVPFPAFRLFDQQTGRFATIVAGDADGDGIADCGLQRLTEINGITYFAGYRVVDHNSAVNVNTAMSHVSDFDGAGNLTSDIAILRNTGSGYTQVTGFFPSHVGLLELLRSYDDNAPGPTLIDQSGEFNELNDWRFGTTFTGAGNTYRAVGVDGNAAATLFPVGDESYGYNLRTDMYFNTVGEALWMQLGRRMENPGPNVSNAPYRSFGIAESAALAYRGSTLLNPNASLTELEGRLAASLQGGGGTGFPRVPARAYRADGQDGWYRNNFLLDLERPLDATPTSGAAVAFHHRRTILTATNAVANAAPRNTSGLNTPQFTIPGQLARYAGTSYVLNGPPNARFEIDRSTDPNLPALAGDLNDVRKRPATKVDVNTASFGDLWRGFWEVMSYPNLRINGVDRPFLGNNDGGGTPFTEYVDLDLARRGGVEGFTPYNPYLGMQFVRGLAVANDPNQSFILTLSNYWTSFVDRAAGAFAVGFHPARMFRSPLRAVPLAGVAPGQPTNPEYGPGTFRMAADQVVLLRSAIAAVNAEQARRRDDNLVVRTFVGYPRTDAGGVGVNDGVAVNIPEKGINGYQEPVGNSFLVAGAPRPALDAGTGNQGLLNQPATVRVFGVARQPFITEVYVNTNNQTDTNLFTPETPNPRGYIAIELFNPYPFPIDIRHCRIFTVDRTPTGPYNVGATRGLVVTDESQAADVNDQIILDPLAGAGLATPQSNMQADSFGFGAGAVIVPPRGWLVLENYQASGAPRGGVDAHAANDRPNSSRISALLGNAADGPLTNASGLVPANTRANFVYVPNLDRVYNKEFVLVRSPRATYPRLVLQSGYQGQVLQYAPPPTQPVGNAPPVPWDIREFAPLDSFDFTGLDCPADSPVAAPLRPTTLQPVIPGMQSAIWHYNRAHPDQNNTLAGNKEWRYVYPGRYDGSQPWRDSTGYPPAESGQPRQQGVRRATFDALALPPGIGDPWDPFDLGAGTPLGTASLGIEVIGLNASYVWFDALNGIDKGEFTIPLHSLEAHRDSNSTDSTMDWAHWPGMNPSVVPYLNIPITNAPGATSTPQPAFFNRYPYGGFARTLDVLQVPYIGSYWIQHAFDFHDGDVATGPQVSPFAGGVNPLAGRSTLDAAQPLPWGIASPYSKRMLEINPVTMDSMFAEDTDHNNDPTLVYDASINQLVDPAGGPDTIHTSKEHVGRFAPLRPSAANGDKVELPDQASYQLGTFNPRYGDYWEDIDAWRYAWAKRLAEHFTVMSQDEDGLAQTNAAAYAFFDAAPTPINGPGPRPPDSVRNRAGTNAPKYTYARVSTGNPGGTGALQIEVTYLPDWIVSAPAGTAITFVGGPHDGQRRPVTGVTVQGGSPARFRITFQASGGAVALDPRPWDASAPILIGDTIRFDGSPEDPGGLEGLININTAPARVLSTLPWFPPPPGEKVSTALVRWDPVNKVLLPGGGDQIDDNWDLAQAIVWYRDRGYTNASEPVLVPGGPFASIFDLYRVPGFKLAQERLIDVGIPGAQADVGILQGDFTFSQLAVTAPPQFPFQTDGLRFDFKEQYLLLNRVSNLITTRSDVFTVYVVIQGWRNVGVPNQTPQFVTERRAATIVDRTAVTPNDRRLKEFRVATE